jgi:hypothetical protein
MIDLEELLSDLHRFVEVEQGTSMDDETVDHMIMILRKYDPVGASRYELALGVRARARFAKIEREGK